MAQLSDLPPSEREVLELVAEGLTNAQIAERRGVHPTSVSTQMSRIMMRIGVGNRVQAARWFLEHREVVV